jgi:hypothetical protein
LGVLAITLLQSNQGFRIFWVFFRVVFGVEVVSFASIGHLEEIPSKKSKAVLNWLK